MSPRPIPTRSTNPATVVMVLFAVIMAIVAIGFLAGYFSAGGCRP